MIEAGSARGVTPTAATAIVALIVVAGLLGCTTPPADLHSGVWRAQLDSPGGPLPFGLELDVDGDRLRATLINGSERLAVEHTEYRDRRLLLEMERYDSRIEAELDDSGRRLWGEWSKTSGAGTRSRLPFSAAARGGARFEILDSSPDPEQLQRFDGRWAVSFDSDEQPAIGVFETRDDGRVLGTFLTTTGDYRFLEGRVDGDRIRLSCFDGAHAFLFDATLGEDDRLHGDFWSRDSWHEQWEARRDPDAVLPDAFELTGFRGEVSLAQMVYADLDGNPVSLNDQRFAGRARIIEVFGTWCPNCNDAIGDLVDLHRRYAERGLSIVGVAFELTGDFERDAAQVRRFAEYHQVEFPLLIGGTSDKALASEAFPLLDRIRSYPTTIFLRGDGTVLSVHQGYTGPATGAEYERLRERFDDTVRRLLADG